MKMSDPPTNNNADIATVLRAVRDLGNRMDEMSITMNRRVAVLESATLSATAFAEQVLTDSGINSTVLPSRSSTQRIATLASSPNVHAHRDGGNPPSESSPKSMTCVSSVSPRRPVIHLMDFDGKSSWEEYEIHLSMVSRANEWSPVESATFLAASLRGPALSYIGALENSILADYSALVGALRRRFGVAMLSGNAYGLFRSRMQRHGEKLVEFANEVQRLARLAYPKWKSDILDNLCIQQFLDGIADADVQCRVREREPPTLHDALEIALKMESSRIATRAARRAANISVVQVEDAEFSGNGNPSA